MKLKNLKNMREAAGLTQKQASEKIGVGQSAVSMRRITARSANCFNMFFEERYIKCREF